MRVRAGFIAGCVLLGARACWVLGAFVGAFYHAFALGKHSKINGLELFYHALYHARTIVYLDFVVLKSRQKTQ